MILKARDLDPRGDYRVIAPGDLRNFAAATFDLVLSQMPFDNIPTMDEKVRTLLEMARVLKPGGIKILVAASHDLYLREWVSWSTADYPENRLAKAGDPVKVAITDLGDRRVVEDTLWTKDAYDETFRRTPLQPLEILRPIARPHDPYQCEWVSEQTHAPFVIFVLRKPETPNVRAFKRHGSIASGFGTLWRILPVPSAAGFGRTPPVPGRLRMRAPGRHPPTEPCGREVAAAN
jgi:SAM-dependent methyltransferase